MAFTNFDQLSSCREHYSITENTLPAQLWEAARERNRVGGSGDNFIEDQRIEADTTPLSVYTSIESVSNDPYFVTWQFLFYLQRHSILTFQNWIDKTYLSGYDNFDEWFNQIEYFYYDGSTTPYLSSYNKEFPLITYDSLCYRLSSEGDTQYYSEPTYNGRYFSSPRPEVPEYVNSCGSSLVRTHILPNTLKLNEKHIFGKYDALSAFNFTGAFSGYNGLWLRNSPYEFKNGNYECIYNSTSSMWVMQGALSSAYSIAIKHKWYQEPTFVTENGETDTKTSVVVAYGFDYGGGYVDYGANGVYYLKEDGRYHKQGDNFYFKYDTFDSYIYYSAGNWHLYAPATDTFYTNATLLGTWSTSAYIEDNSGVFGYDYIQDALPLVHEKYHILNFTELPKITFSNQATSDCIATCKLVGTILNQVPSVSTVQDSDIIQDTETIVVYSSANPIPLTKYWVNIEGIDVSIDGLPEEEAYKRGLVTTYYDLTSKPLYSNLNSYYSVLHNLYKDTYKWMYDSFKEQEYYKHIIGKNPINGYGYYSWIGYGWEDARNHETKINNTLAYPAAWVLGANEPDITDNINISSTTFPGSQVYSNSYGQYITVSNYSRDPWTYAVNMVQSGTIELFNYNTEESNSGDLTISSQGSAVWTTSFTIAPTSSQTFNWSITNSTPDWYILNNGDNNIIWNFSITPDEETVVRIFTAQVNYTFVGPQLYVYRYYSGLSANDIATINDFNNSALYHDFQLYFKANPPNYASVLNEFDGSEITGLRDSITTMISSTINTCVSTFIWYPPTSAMPFDGDEYNFTNKGYIGNAAIGCAKYYFNKL